MTKLTDRQRELLQEDKCTLVDTIIVTEHKLEQAVEEIQFLNNEMLLCQEANIAAQQELDGDKEPETMTKEQNKKFREELNILIGEADKKRLKNISDTEKMKDIEKCIDGAWEGEISADNFVERVTNIFTGDYYDKIQKQSSKVD